MIICLEIISTCIKIISNHKRQVYEVEWNRYWSMNFNNNVTKNTSGIRIEIILWFFESGPKFDFILNLVNTLPNT